MGSQIWNYLSGYVIIQIKGLSLEKLLNRALKADVRLWNIKRTEENTLNACVDAEGLVQLRKLKKGLNCRIKILEKHGLPVKLRLLRFRPVLATGWLIIAVLLLSATRCIWVIDVTGNDSVATSNVLERLNDMGIHPGSGRRGLVLGELGSAITSFDERIAWTSVELEGVVLKIDITEVSAHKPIVDDSVPASIYASRDGRIISVTALNGRPMVEPGDIVKAGELLISGTLTREGTQSDGEEQDTLLVNARGSVIAETTYVFRADAGPELELPVRSGNSESCMELSVLGYDLPKKNAAYAEAETENEQIKILSNCFLPLTIRTYTSCELIRRMQPANEQTLKTEAEKKAQELMLSKLPADARILSKSTAYYPGGDGSLSAVITVTAQFDIGEKREIG